MADPVGPVYINCDCCTGSVFIACCNDNLPQTLDVTVVNSCGTYTGTLVYDPTLGGGIAKCWFVSISLQCDPGGGCEAHTFEILLCCTLTGLWTLTIGCDGGNGTTITNYDVVCEPFSIATIAPLVTCSNCASSITITE